jgi:opacity protein-like surface antigen
MQTAAKHWELTGRRGALVECRAMRISNRCGIGGWPRAGRAAALGCTVLALALCLGAADARAQSGKGDYMGSWSVAGSLGYAVPNTDEYGNAMSWRVGVGYSPAPQIEFDLEVGGFESEVSQPDPNGLPSHTIANGNLTIRPVCLTAQLRWPLPEALSTLTVSGGVGYYFIDYAMDEEPRAALAAAAGEDAEDQHVDDDWGYHVGAGLEYALTEHIALVAETRYVFLSPSAGGASGADSRFGGSLGLNTWLFGGGVKVAF